MFLCWQEIVPSYLATSPIMSTGEELMQSQLGRGSSRHHGRPYCKRHFEIFENVSVLFFFFFKQFSCYSFINKHIDTIPCSSLPVQSLGPQQSDGGVTKKRRKRRRKARPEAGGGGGRREESAEEFSEDEDMFTIDLSSDEEREDDGSRCVLCVCVWLYWSPPPSSSSIIIRSNTYI